MTVKDNWPEKLLRWFRQEGRELPWRENRTPYSTWVSEVMLQQTKVETVRPYFYHWMERFPSPEAVAETDESEVLHAWQGLGYYNRARNLQQAMREVVAEYDGEIPGNEKALRSLPGIGPYMAGAILSLAFNKATPAVDGNVLRVFARLYGITDNVLTMSTRKKVTQLAEEVIPQEAPGMFNEALMDLGATVCTPGKPNCTICPLRENCNAYVTGRTEMLPVRVKKTKQPLIYIATAILRYKERYLLRRRPAKGMLANMWEFPSVEATTAQASREELRKKWTLPKYARPCWQHRHVFSHRIWEMRAYDIIVTKDEMPGTEYAWYDPEEFLHIPMAGPHAGLAAFILERM